MTGERDDTQPMPGSGPDRTLPEPAPTRPYEDGPVSAWLSDPHQPTHVVPHGSPTALERRSPWHVAAAVAGGCALLGLGVFVGVQLTGSRSASQSSASPVPTPSPASSSPSAAGSGDVVPATISSSSQGKTFQHLAKSCDLVKPGTIALYAPATRCQEAQNPISGLGQYGLQMEAGTWDDYKSAADFGSQRIVITAEVAIGGMGISSAIDSIYSTDKQMFDKQLTAGSGVKDERDLAGIGDKASLSYGVYFGQCSAAAIAESGNAVIYVQFTGSEPNKGYSPSGFGYGPPYPQQKCEDAAVAMLRDAMSGLS